jgi:SAM-dependent methyltransferase
LLDPQPGERILDIGCGTGEHLLLFSKLGLDVTGVDPSKYMLAKAKERLGSRCTLSASPAEDLPFDDNEFELSVFINTLEFVNDPLQALMEAGRVTRRKVFVGALNSLSWNGFLKKIQGYLGNPLFGRASFYNLWELKFLFQKAYGSVPMAWSCVRTLPSFLHSPRPSKQQLSTWSNLPFGSFLGVSATMRYTVRTDNMPLKRHLEKATGALIGARTMEDLHRSKGA